ncbi:MAG: large conductance mechanosensitive channel protein MscL [Saprospiraceae bacterium]|nr:MAG: large conductance mechanosensitive channel protein [Bacteroidetes bacterium OLB9]MCO6464099.1 large conductance mechanosensitive channel protein MscL [Saprospiraceae bacterium]
MLKEFKEFAMKGNLLDIAIGMAMAAAFGKVTDGFVNGIFMPIVGRIFQIGDLSSWKIVLAPATVGSNGEAIAEVAITYGALISAIINFLVIAWVMFMIVKAVNKLKKPEEAPAPAGPSQEELLTEIRDLLKK